MRIIKLLIILIASPFYSVFSVYSFVKGIPQKTDMDFIRHYEVWNEVATRNLSEDTGFHAKDECVKLLKNIVLNLLIESALIRLGKILNNFRVVQ